MVIKNTKKNTKKITKTAKPVKSAKTAEKKQAAKNLKETNENQTGVYTKYVTRKHKEKSKQRILNATAKLFAEKGYDGASIREICHEADANICMVSYFWGGKKALYDGIVKELEERETQYAKKFLNIEQNPKKLKKEEQIELLYTVIDKIIEFIYGGWISNEMYRFLLQEQQNKRIVLVSPVFDYLKKVVACVFDKTVNDKSVVLKTLFILSLINSPVILPVYSLDLLNKKAFQPADINVIKNNVKLYVNTILNEK